MGHPWVVGGLGIAAYVSASNSEVRQGAYVSCGWSAKKSGYMKCHVSARKGLLKPFACAIEGNSLL
jgi:hypothetical protein